MRPGNRQDWVFSFALSMFPVNMLDCSIFVRALNASLEGIFGYNLYETGLTVFPCPHTIPEHHRLHDVLAHIAWLAVVVYLSAL